MGVGSLGRGWWRHWGSGIGDWGRPPPRALSARSPNDRGSRVKTPPIRLWRTTSPRGAGRDKRPPPPRVARHLPRQERGRHKRIWVARVAPSETDNPCAGYDLGGCDVGRRWTTRRTGCQPLAEQPVAPGGRPVRLELAQAGSAVGGCHRWMVVVKTPPIRLRRTTSPRGAGRGKRPPPPRFARHFPRWCGGGRGLRQSVGRGGGGGRGGLAWLARA